MKKIIVEKFISKKVGFVYEGEFTTTAALAQHCKLSPAKVRNFVAEMPSGEWRRFGEYRFGKID
jgi:hypothetical protein